MATDSKNYDFFLALLTGKKYRIIRHALLMILFAMLFVADVKQNLEFKGKYQIVGKLIPTALLIGCFYINMYVLIPRTIYLSKHTRYVLYLVLLIVCAFVFLKASQVLLLEKYRLKPVEEKAGFISTILIGTIFMILVLLPSTALKVFQRWVDDNSRINELEKRALESELKALKNQINPHFLFNMLNNVNVLIMADPVKAQLVMQKLSDFLRYYLYENADDAVFLNVDIKFLTEYLNIEKLRKDDFEFKIVSRYPITKGVKIPSNMLMTFVENAVKHGANPGGSQRIRIAISLIGSHIKFECTNSRPAPGRVDSRPGLGLANVIRRLELEYRGEHILKLYDLKTVYKVELQIPL